MRVANWRSRLSPKPTLPGLMRYFASASAQAGWSVEELVADVVEVADDRHMDAAPASASRMCGTAAAASSRSTVTRTSSEPARTSAATCSTVAATSAVSVLVIDWTTTGAPPPTCTSPTMTGTVWRRGWGAVMSSASIRSSTLPLEGEGRAEGAGWGDER